MLIMKDCRSPPAPPAAAKRPCMPAELVPGLRTQPGPDGNLAQLPGPVGTCQGGTLSQHSMPAGHVGKR